MTWLDTNTHRCRYACSPAGLPPQQFPLPSFGSLVPPPSPPVEWLGGLGLAVAMWYVVMPAPLWKAWALSFGVYFPALLWDGWVLWAAVEVQGPGGEGGGRERTAHNHDKNMCIRTYIYIYVYRHMYM